MSFAVVFHIANAYYRHLEGPRSTIVPLDDIVLVLKTTYPRMSPLPCPQPVGECTTAACTRTEDPLGIIQLEPITFITA